MRKDREKAVALRQQGKSYATITKKLGIPKATLSGWFKDQPWSVLIRDTLSAIPSSQATEKIKKMVLANKQRSALRHLATRQEAEKQFTPLRLHPLFIPALILYWSRGDLNLKRPLVHLSVSEPSLAKLFFLFLTQTLHYPENKVTFRLWLYSDLISSVQQNFWRKASGIPLDCFRPSVMLKSKFHRVRRSFGTGALQIYDRSLKEKIVTWISLLEKFLWQNV